DPEHRLLIVHHRLHTLLYTYLAKGKRTSGDHTTVYAADNERLSIIGSQFVVGFLDNLFVTGKLNISTQQHIGKPHQRIKPMDCQQEETKGLPPMIFTTDVRLFVGNNVFQILTVHVEREIDSRLDNAQDKGRCDILALENVVPEDDSFTDLAPQTPIANGGIHKEDSDTGHPDHAQNRNPNLEWICAGARSRGK